MSKMTTKQRRRKLETCGKACFLGCCDRKAKKAGHPRYPVCAHGCEPDCKSAHSAFIRAASRHERKIKAKAVALGKRLGCRWAEGK